MQKVRIDNRRGGLIKLPNGKKVKSGQSVVVPVGMLMHKSLRKLISVGRVKVASATTAIEKVTDHAIHSVRDKVDAAIDVPEVEAVTDTILDVAEDIVEDAVDSVIDAAADAVNSVLDSVESLLGDSDDEDDSKPKRKGRRKKSDA